MVYSVWNPRTRLYDYYASGGSDFSVPSPTHLHGRVPAAAAGWPLPADAERQGSGPFPKGMIATSRSFLGLGDTVSDSLASFIGIGIIVWFALRRK